MKKKWLIISAALAVILAIVITLAIVLPKRNNNNNDPNSGGGTNYNIMLTSATIPATLSGMDTVKGEDKTYYWLERPETFKGIGDLTQYTKIPMAVASPSIDTNLLTETKKLITQLDRRTNNATFTFYITDMYGFMAFRAALESGLNENQFKVIMVEDGAGTYGNFINAFVTGKNLVNDVDQPYDAYLATVNRAQALVQEVKEGRYTGDLLTDLTLCFGLATLDNCSLWLQDLSAIKSEMDQNVTIANSKLYSALGLNEGSQETGIAKMNIINKNQAATVAAMTDTEKTKYLSLVFGKVYAERTKNLMERTEVEGIQVQSRKLIFISTTLTSFDSYKLVTDISDISEISTYESMAQEFKDLFSVEEMQFILDTMQATNSTTKHEVFNLYAEFKKVLSILKDEYGDTYDLLYKDHPKFGPEDGQLEITGNRWKTHIFSGTDTAIKGEALYKLVNNFFKTDSVGKLIGVLPTTISAENFAFAGYQFSACGFDSSYYKGRGENVPVEFVLALSDAALANTFDTCATLLRAGTLNKPDGTPATIMNGYQIRKIAGIDLELGAEYDIANDGTIVKVGLDGTTSISRKIVYNFNYTGAPEVVSYDIQNGTDISEFTMANPTREGYTFAGWYTNQEGTTGNAYVPAVLNNTSEQDILVYAAWTKNITIKYGENSYNVSIKVGTTLPETLDELNAFLGLSGENALKEGTYKFYSDAESLNAITSITDEMTTIYLVKE